MCYLFGMKKVSCARIVFGASAVLFGVIGLMWHDVYTWQNLVHLWKLPLGSFIGTCLMAAQIAGGIGILYSRTARPASVVLGVVYLCFALACVPDMVAPTNVYDKYGCSLLMYFSFFCGAIAVYAATEADGRKALLFGRTARIGLGICAISFMLGQALLLRETAGAVPKWIPPSQMFWAVVTTVAFGLAAVAILANVRARLAMRLMAFMIALFGVLVWVPHLVAHPEAHYNWSEIALTLLAMSAAWTVSELRGF